MTGAARSFWTYWSASATSNLGSAVGAVALPLTAITVLDASPFEMGLIAAASYAAWLVIGLPAGALVARLPLRGTQVTMDLARALAVASVPVAWWLDRLSIAQLVVVALVLSFANVVFDVANSTFLPAVVPKEQLHERNSLMSATFATTQLGGPSIGGLAIQLLGAVPTLLVNAVSYLLSGILLRTLPSRPPAAAGADRVPMRQMIGEGWRFVTRHPVMAPCMWAATAVNFVCGAQMALFALYLVRDLDTPAAFVGFLLAAEGVGSLVGAALSPRIVRTLGSARACVASSVVSLIGGALIPVGTGWVAWVCFALGNIIFAGGVVIFSTATRTYRQQASPPEMLSRVMATVRFVSWGAIPVGGLVAGLVATWIGARWALVVFGALGVVQVAVVFASRIRLLRDLTDLDELLTPAVASHS
ncbi:MFS transporter [Knoellia subterranea]|uniref:MFS transporter n=1 Tax=Knoellia subterranea KCTC 19937 TaxID=1385521 RepID=A0A0A0JM51_9MICO|nr:MFS transporter [Knoellia subterranea]KGN38213.1 MFS transporter [Knoellia subterranea KCTC 19937]